MIKNLPWVILASITLGSLLLPTSSTALVAPASPCALGATCAACFCTNQGGCDNPCVSDCPPNVIITGNQTVSCCISHTRYTFTWTMKQCVCGGPCGNSVVSTCETITNPYNTGAYCS